MIAWALITSPAWIPLLVGVVFLTVKIYQGKEEQ